MGCVNRFRHPRARVKGGGERALPAPPLVLFTGWDRPPAGAIDGAAGLGSAAGEIGGRFGCAPARTSAAHALTAFVTLARAREGRRRTSSAGTAACSFYRLGSGHRLVRSTAPRGGAVLFNNGARVGGWRDRGPIRIRPRSNERSPCALPAFVTLARARRAAANELCRHRRLFFLPVGIGHRLVRSTAPRGGAVLFNNGARVGGWRDRGPLRIRPRSNERSPWPGGFARFARRARGERRAGERDPHPGRPAPAGGAAFCGAAGGRCRFCW